MKRILVPTSCDSASELALRMATALSEKNNARIYLLRVVKTHGGAYFNKDGDIVEDHGHDIQKYVSQKEEETKRLAEWANPINDKAVQVVRYGGVADAILETINKYKVGLVIMGNRFIENEPYRFFGDLTSYLIKGSKVPLLSLKGELTSEGLNHIVFANEFDHKLSFYDALQDIHLYCHSNVEFLHVKTGKSKSSDEEIYENMDYFAKINMIANYTKTIFKADKVEPGILEWISQNPCDLLAVKNVTKSGSPLFKPKLSKEFVRNMHISTLIYND